MLRVPSSYQTPVTPPVCKQGNFYLGPDRSELDELFFGPKRYKNVCGMGHPLMHTTANPYRWGVSTNHKSLDRIELSQSAQDLLHV